MRNLFNPNVSIFSLVSSSSKISSTTVVYRGVKVTESSIGAHTYIAAHSYVENAVIGKFCSISDHCRIGMSGHSLAYASTSPLFTERINALHEKWIDKDVFENKDEKETLYIGNDVWIGSHALIKGGVKIGDGACIGAGAVVTKDIPPYAIVGGVPAHIIRYRFSKPIIDKLMELKWWELDEIKLKKEIHFFQRPIIELNDIDGYSF